MTAKAAVKLTDLTVQTLKHDPARRLEIPDPGQPGLYLIIQSSGTKSWACRYRVAGKTVKLTLGAYPGLSLKDARVAAKRSFGKLANGKDPAD